MIGDAAVAPAPPQVSNEQIIELWRGAILMAGVNCITLTQNAGQWYFDPAPPSTDTVAFVLAHASLMYFSATPALSYKTRAISGTIHPQAMEDLRRNARNLIHDIEARGMVCSATPQDGTDMISLLHDLVCRTYTFMPHPHLDSEPCYTGKTVF